ncbi:MAG TPA: ABC transporter substrate-binding protein [Shinella sp.]|uniref:ABC transporter substrate-binding protein n=1 Tax=Shinella sp. TaxID=1870904 RepID=UPI002E122BBA|nr:ABC transporter substrate-binding protein [Shinella sp.]
MKITTFAASAFLVLAGTNFALANSFGECKVTGEAVKTEFVPLKDDTLVVATVLPNPGWWNGTSPTEITSGYEYCLAAQIAHRAGFSQLEIKNLAWDQLITGAAKGYDIAMAGVTITEKRRAAMDFSAPYFNSDLGVASKPGADVTSDNIRQKRIGVIQGSTGADWVINTLKADNPPAIFQSNPEAFTSLAAGQVDVVITDTVLLLAAAKTTGGRIAVQAQFKAEQPNGIVMPKGSVNIQVVNEIIADLEADGSLAELTKAYLVPMFGGNPDDIPFWEVK